MRMSRMHISEFTYDKSFGSQTRVGLRRKKTIIILGFLLIIAFTRAIDLTHNIFLHPDEGVFYRSTDNLMLYIFGRSSSYNVEKPYPEGAYVFQLPFHILAKGIKCIFGYDISSQIAGRISSVFYYILGFLTAIYIMVKHCKCMVKALIVYGVIAVFSIVHVEQSRYGTGDPISFFLLMLILLFTGNGLIRHKYKRWWLIAAFLVCGMICGVKYPLLFFCLIPFSAVLRLKERVRMYFIFVLFIIIGFLIVSPQVMKDPSFLLKAIKSETYSYLIQGNETEVGGGLNHLISVLMYFSFFSSILFAPYYSFVGIKEIGEVSKDEKDLRYLFYYIVPSFALLFCVYNLFVKTIFMRTFYPFFCIMDIYTAIGVSDCLTKKKKKLKIGIAWALLILSIVRGGYYIAVLTEEYGTQRLEQISLEATDNSWEKTILMKPGYLLPIDESKYKAVQRIELSQCNKIEELQPGTLLISHSIDFGMGSPYILSINHSKANEYISLWSEFERINSKYYIGQVYPRLYYYLFGYWIKGTTGNPYEFPSNYVYYH